jgi:hypothetical protein
MRSDWYWVKTPDLVIGDVVKYIVKPWDVDKTWDAGWLAGMFDGEGCLSFKKDGACQLSVTQRESLTAEHLNDILKEKTAGDIFGRYHYKAKEDGWQDQSHFIIGNRANVLRLLGSIRPPRLLVKSNKVWEGNPISGRDKEATIVSIKNAGKGVIAMLSTSTKTYIANGFAMHNSMNEFRDTLRDQASKFISREEINLLLAKPNDVIENLQRQINMVVTRAEHEGVITKLDAEIRQLNKSKDQLEGKASQRSVYIAYILAGISLLMAVAKLWK